MKSHFFTPRSHAKEAFTLSELLVVIAIIAILATILFPVFANVRAKARQTACMSNMKQLGLGVAQYYQDFDEGTPNGTYYFASLGGWAGQIYAYVKSDKVFRCPDDIKVYSTTDKSSSYGINSNFGTGGNLSAVPPVPNTSISISKMNAPAMTVMLFEVEGNTGVDVTLPKETPFTNNTTPSPFGNGSIGNYSPNGGGTIGAACGSNPANEKLKYATGYIGTRDARTFPCHFTGMTGRHADGSNFLMADTHAKWLKGAQVSSGGNAATSTAAMQTYIGGAAGGTEAPTVVGKAGATFSIL